MTHLKTLARDEAARCKNCSEPIKPIPPEECASQEICANISCTVEKDLKIEVCALFDQPSAVGGRIEFFWTLLI